MPLNFDHMGAITSSLSDLSVAVKNYTKYSQVFVTEDSAIPLDSNKKDGNGKGTNMEDGDKEPKWALESWLLHINNDVAPWRKYDDTDQFGLKTAGSLNDLFVPWNWADVVIELRYPGPEGFFYVNAKKEENLQDMAFRMESSPPQLIVGNDRISFHQILRRLRHLYREKHTKERNNAEWRKAPMFSRTQRNKEARDYRISTMIGKKEKFPRLSLMGLPSELRLNILRQLFSKLEMDAWTVGGQHPLRLLQARFDQWNAVSDPIAILLTCRELYFEGHAIFQEETLFRSRLQQKFQLDTYQVTMLSIGGFGPYSWKDAKYQKMLPRVKRMYLQIENPECHCTKFPITYVSKEYGRDLQTLIEKQASEALWNENNLLELTVNLERGRKMSTPISDYEMKKSAIDALLAFTGRVKVMRITGDIPASLKKYARDTEINIQMYDDTLKKPVSLDA